MDTRECFRLSGNKKKLQQAHIILLSNVFATKNNTNVYVYMNKVLKLKYYIKYCSSSTTPAVLNLL